MVSSSSGSRGGGEFYLVWLARGLLDLGHEVRILMSNHVMMDDLQALCEQLAVPCDRFRYRNTYLRRTRTLGAWLDHASVTHVQQVFAEYDADIVHLNLQCVDDGIDLIRAASNCGKRSVATIHVTRTAASLGARFGMIRDWLARRTIRQSAMPSIGISRVSADDLARWLDSASPGFPQDNEDVQNPDASRCVAAGSAVYCVPNGVKSPTPGNRQELREEWGLTDDDFAIGCVARLEPQKNPRFVIPLLKQLPEHIRVVWVGDGRLHDDLEAEIRQEHLQHRVILDGWQADAAGRMAGFDLFFLPSLFEGLPLAILEAMAMGLPCVVSDVDGTRDAIEDGLQGYRCPVNDTLAWAAAIRRIESSGLHRGQLASAALHRYQQNFSLESMCRRTLAVYEDILQAQEPMAIAEKTLS